MGSTLKQSAGLLLYRRSSGVIEVFLAHLGGPFWASKDEGAWTIPKGVPDPGEDFLDAAIREFQEETGIAAMGPFVPLGTITQKSGKVVHAWAWEGDAEAGSPPSNKVKVEWPTRSGKWITVPEVDRCEWFGEEEAAKKLNPAQVELLDRLQQSLNDPSAKHLRG
jgi:predicted NUDIX family NTP pyrophosphohydrolase